MVSVALVQLLGEEDSDAVTLAVIVLERHDNDVIDGDSDTDGDALTDLDRIGDRDIDGDEVCGDDFDGLPLRMVDPDGDLVMRGERLSEGDTVAVAEAPGDVDKDTSEEDDSDPRLDLDGEPDAVEVAHGI